jgi:hypothetical protein
VSGQYQGAVDFIDNEYKYEMRLDVVDADEAFIFVIVCDALKVASLYSVIFGANDVFLIANSFVSNVSFVVIKVNYIPAFTFGVKEGNDHYKGTTLKN